jgi:Ca2+/Na+ antiporter
MFSALNVLLGITIGAWASPVPEQAFSSAVFDIQVRFRVNKHYYREPVIQLFFLIYLGAPWRKRKYGREHTAIICVVYIIILSS